MRNTKRLRISDLKLGKVVRTYQLDEILDTYIVLLNTKEVIDSKLITALEGKIVFFGNQKTKDFYNTYKKYNNESLCVIINRAEYIE